MAKQKIGQVRTLTAKEVEEFEALQAQIESLHAEMQTLVRKSPNDLLNKCKLRLVNAVLLRANALLGAQYRPFPDFDHFAEDEIPSNSDVMLILNQYLAAMETMRGDHIYQEYGSTYVWMIDGSPSEVKTAQPLKLTKK